MATFIDTTHASACKSGTRADTDTSPNFLESVGKSKLRRSIGVAENVALDHVYRVLRSLDEHGDRRELGDLVDAIDDAASPIRVIEAMIEAELIMFTPGYAFDAAIPVERVR
ncbi:MAG: hypothetical protein JJU21_12175 [Salinarimonas sp.]|nr:hypothetical protein [Salinarimonas sp.]